MAYTVESTETFEREFAKHHRDRVEWLKRTVEKLEQNPQLGKPLRGRLHGTWQLRVDPFRVWYEINDREKKVTLKAILHKKAAERLY
jgi:mRNA interferase RelE/StbE